MNRHFYLSRCGPLVAIALLSLQPARAQVEAATPSPPAVDASAEEAVMQNIARMVAEDDLEGAIGDLEDLHAAGKAGPKALATLGALYNELELWDDTVDLLRPLADHPEANPALLYNVGRAALQVAEPGSDLQGQAETYLRRSVTLQPISPAARLLGLRLGAQGRTQVAYQLLRPWALANPDDHEGRFAAAAAATRLQRVDEALELLDGLPETLPRWRILSADLALQQRQPDRTVELLADLADAPPPEMRVDLWVLLATARMELGQSAEAVALLEDRVADHPRLALALSQAHYQNGQVEAALALLGPLVQPVMALSLEDLSPEDLPASQRDLAADVTLQAGRVLVASDRADEALPLLERAAQLENWNREVWQELARAYAATGQSEPAAEARQRFQDLAQAKERAQVPGLQGRQKLQDTLAKRLAEALEWQERGDGAKALSIVRQEISLAPDDLRPRLMEVRLLLAQGHLDEALLSADASVEAFPEQPAPRHFRAVAKLGSGQVESAEEDLREALRLAPNHVPAKNDLAYLLMGRGDLDGARILLEDILTTHPEDALARQRLAQLDQLGGPSETP